jgi:hypothetical protein
MHFQASFALAMLAILTAAKTIRDADKSVHPSPTQTEELSKDSSGVCGVYSGQTAHLGCHAAPRLPPVSVLRRVLASVRIEQLLLRN